MAKTYHCSLDSPMMFKVLCLLLCLAGANALVSLTTQKTSKNINASHPRAHLCNHAYHLSSCLAVLSEVTQPSARLIQPRDAILVGLTLAKSWLRMQSTQDFAGNLSRQISDERAPVALADCLELLDSSMERVLDSMAALGKQTAASLLDVQMWVSGILTNHFTCLQGLNGEARLVMEPMMNELMARARASLAMAAAISSPPKEEALRPLNGRDLPPWITRKDRRLLKASGKNIKADSVVAQDGSGDHRTVQEAIDAAPESSQARYVIHVKQGTYKEQVMIGKIKRNVMLVGDGMDATIISGSLNVVDGSSTVSSATVTALGDGFIAQDIGFQNTAGPQKGQAVALFIRADLVVMNRCKIDAYQDTLYAHSLRQFYRDCYISGTVDFIFGDAAVVFQNCQLVARKPLGSQQNMITAQGRNDPNSPTGTSIQNCNITSSSDLETVKGTVKTFLGRPWQRYSRTVVMESVIGDHIDPAGWSSWGGDFALDTLYYGEYKNSGPGARTSKRVRWPGYHVITRAAEARKFTVAQLLHGGQWLKNTGVTYKEGL